MTRRTSRDVGLLMSSVQGVGVPVIEDEEGDGDEQGSSPSFSEFRVGGIRSGKYCLILYELEKVSDSLNVCSRTCTILYF